jgi:hypothetical protein
VQYSVIASCVEKYTYTYSIDKRYTNEEIEKAKKSPSFPREYQLQYQDLIGNVFSYSIYQVLKRDSKSPVFY